MFSVEKVKAYLEKEQISSWSQIQNKIQNTDQTAEPDYEVNTGITFLG